MSPSSNNFWKARFIPLAISTAFSARERKTQLSPSKEETTLLPTGLWAKTPGRHLQILIFKSSNLVRYGN